MRCSSEAGYQDFSRNNSCCRIGLKVQRFSPDIPWVLIWREPRGPLFSLRCEVCGGSDVGDLDEANRFAAAHRVHAAPQGSLRLGDAFATVAKPVARAFGRAPCTPCEARRRALNSLKF